MIDDGVRLVGNMTRLRPLWPGLAPLCRACSRHSLLSVEGGLEKVRDGLAALQPRHRLDQRVHAQALQITTAHADTESACATPSKRALRTRRYGVDAMRRAGGESLDLAHAKPDKDHAGRVVSLEHRAVSRTRRDALTCCVASGFPKTAAALFGPML